MAEADAIAEDLVAPCSSKVCTWVSQDQERLLVYLLHILRGLWHMDEERKIVGAATNAIAELVAGYPPPALDKIKKKHCVDELQPHLPHGIFNFGFWRQQGHPQRSSDLESTHGEHNLRQGDLGEQISSQNSSNCANNGVFVW
jgi:hypothetical protein